MFRDICYFGAIIDSSDTCLSPNTEPKPELGLGLLMDVEPFGDVRADANDPADANAESESVSPLLPPMVSGAGRTLVLPGVETAIAEPKV